MKFHKTLVKEKQFQEMKKYLGIQVRNFCTGCGEELHEPIYCEECQKQLNRIRSLRQKFE